ncbi:MAG: alpha-hydroxy-acid oxidizing protein [Solirubrobacterales bacterium]|nr:alpha-hydroxy-acid oxidizing protein [Solirubrobacterales bacterium]
MADRRQTIAPSPVNVGDYERLAARCLDEGLLGYYAGGAGDERTLRDNVAAFARRRLRPRVLVDVSAVSAATTVLGTDVSMPLLVAPTALQRMAHPDGEPGMARAAAAAGTIFCLSTLATSRPSEVAEQAPAAPRWFQLYAFRDRGVTRALCDEALEHGFGAIVLTVDAPRAGRRERDLRTGFVVPAGVDMPAVSAATGAPACPTPAEFFSLLDTTLTWSAVEHLVANLPVPLILKGIQTAEDARLACEHGAAAVIVSNHGGRQLDGVAASLDMLPEVVDAVGGRLEVLVDGGVRRGTDVLVALALGARAVLAGRPLLWGLAVDGEVGAGAVLQGLQEEIELGMTLLGTPTPADITRAHIAP